MQRWHASSGGGAHPSCRRPASWRCTCHPARRSSAPCGSAESWPGSRGCRGSRCTWRPSFHRRRRPGQRQWARHWPGPGAKQGVLFIVTGAVGSTVWREGGEGGAQRHGRYSGLGLPAAQSGRDYREAPYILNRVPFRRHGANPRDEIPRFRPVRGHARPDAGRQRRGHAQAPTAGQGRTRHRQDHAGRRSGHRAEHAAAAVAHQEHHQGPAGPVRIRRGEPPARQPDRHTPRARPRSRTLPTTSSRACCGRPSRPSNRWPC
jgi:hypothetical protein